MIVKKWIGCGYASLTAHFLRRCFSANVKNTQDVSHINETIIMHTEVTRSKLTPEVALHLITPSTTLWNEPLENVPFKDPFWAFYWPGGQGLTRFILDNPCVVSGHSVLDLGSGCGACAIAAAKSEAKFVIANDIDPVAVCAITLNCQLNNIKVTVNSEQMIGSQEVVSKCLLVGDMFYDENFADMLIKWLLQLRKLGTNIFVGDPGRLSFMKYKKYFLHSAEYPLEHDLSPGFSSVSVWEMKHTLFSP